MRPLVGWTNPATARSAVVLPEPDGPIRAMISPTRMSREKFSSTTRPPYATVTPSKVMPSPAEITSLATSGAAEAAPPIATSIVMSVAGDFPPLGGVVLELGQNLVPVRRPDRDAFHQLVELLVGVVGRVDVLADRQTIGHRAQGALRVLGEQEVDQLLAGISVRRTLHEADVVRQREGRAFSIRARGPEDADVRVGLHLIDVHLHVAIGDEQLALVDQRRQLAGRR